MGKSFSQTAEALRTEVPGGFLLKNAFFFSQKKNLSLDSRMRETEHNEKRP